MAAYALQLDVDDFVAGHWRGPGPSIPNGMVEVTEQVAADSRQKFHPGTSVYKWKYVNDALEEQEDTRPTGTWSVTTVDLNKGDATQGVTLTLSISYTGTAQIVEFSSGHRFRPSFTDGVATLTVQTDTTGQVIFNSSPDVRLLNQLRVRILEDEDIRPL